MTTEKTLCVHTDDLDVIELAAQPGPGLPLAGVAAVSAATLTASLKATLGVLSQSFGEATSTLEYYSVSEVRFRLRVSAKGELSVISLAKGGMEAESGIEVVLQPTTHTSSKGKGGDAR